MNAGISNTFQLNKIQPKAHLIFKDTFQIRKKANGTKQAKRSEKNVKREKKSKIEMTFCFE